MSATPPTRSEGTAIRTPTAPPPWLLAVMLGMTVAFLGAWEATEGFTLFGPWQRDKLLVALAMAAAVSTYRLLPSAGLAVVWVLLLMHLLQPVDVLKVELFVAVLAYGVARYGSWPTVAWSALSVPSAAVVALALIRRAPHNLLVDSFYIDITGVGMGTTGGDAVRVLGLMAFVVLAIPWLLGMLVRTTSRMAQARAAGEVAEKERRQAEEQRARAEEVARLQEGQTRLARDVHDVVGHSLAVILAQAESAQFLPEDDPARLKATFATIADSARESLQSVRRVLSSTAGPDATEADLPAGGLDGLVDGVRSAGRQVVSEVDGTPRLLPPELEVIAFRVLQEMLTNALRHGAPHGVLQVRRTWSDQLTLEVANPVPPEQPDAGKGDAGRGLDGMRRRLHAVGGQLTVMRDGDWFTARATMPTRATELGTGADR